MSEIQRFDIRGESWGIVKRTDGLGAFCWYDEAVSYRRQYWMALIINIVVVLACAVLVALLVHEKTSHGPVAVPMGAGEKASMLNDIQGMQKQRDDQARLTANYKARIKALDGKIIKLESALYGGWSSSTAPADQTLRELSVPKVRTIREPFAVQKEAKRVLGVNVKVVE